jgi:hypothetical protein
MRPQISLSDLNVPSADSADNVNMVDVIGNKTDTHDGTSLYSLSDILNDHVHKGSKVYPTLAAPTPLAKAAGAWAAFPTPTQIIPASTISLPFDIHWVNISSISANGDFELKLYKGAALSEVEIAHIAFSRTAVQSQEGAQPIQMPIQVADERISAAISSSNAAADTVAVKLYYHEY